MVLHSLCTLKCTLQCIVRAGPLDKANEERTALLENFAEVSAERDAAQAENLELRATIADMQNHTGANQCSMADIPGAL